MARVRCTTPARAAAKALCSRITASATTEAMLTIRPPSPRAEHRPGHRPAHQEDPVKVNSG